MRIKIAILAAIGILGFVNYSIWQKEILKSRGKVIYLELAPVDPRSLMQGDYMALRFAIAQEIMDKLGLSHFQNPDKALNPDTQKVNSSSLRRMIATLDERSVASDVELDQGIPLREDQVYIPYRMRDHRVVLTTNAFFFQEGSGHLYENARYGEFRISPDGKMVLIHLVDEQFQILGDRLPEE